MVQAGEPAFGGTTCPASLGGQNSEAEAGLRVKGTPLILCKISNVPLACETSRVPLVREIGDVFETQGVEVRNQRCRTA